MSSLRRLPLNARTARSTTSLEAIFGPQPVSTELTPVGVVHDDSPP
jgi:hypothetical protein